MKVNNAEYDLVLSFFMNVTSNNRSLSGVYTALVFEIATQTKTKPIDVLEQFRSLSSLKLSETMAYYMNTVNGKKTVLHGILDPLESNKSVTRNIIT